MTRPRPVPLAFTGSHVERAGVERRDEAWVAARRARPGTGVLVLSADGHVIRDAGDGAPRAGLRRLGEDRSLAAALATRPHVPLGLVDGEAVFAVDFGDDAPPLAAGHRIETLRGAAALLPAPEAAMLAQAAGLIHWRRRQRFRGRCGAACLPREAGHVMACTGCGLDHFPRTDPAVIMLVARGERVLLARAPRFEGRMFSVLAGFVEPGENLEEAVAREVREECGLAVARIRYRWSQPWPFPRSVMLGFVAEAAEDGAPLRTDPEEIAEAGFFTRDEVRRREADGWRIPPPISIARRLIDAWLEGDA